MAINGTSGNDTLVGTSAAEEINGLSGDDLVTGNGGNDTLDGGAGADTAVFSGNRADYAITYNSGDSSWTVEHLGGGADGTDTVRNIEFLQFADQTIPTSLTAVPVVDQGIGNQTATEDSAFSFAVPTDAFEDVDAGDSLTYSAALTGGGALPAWLSFDGTTFSGTPTNDEVGSLSVEVTATDQSGATVTETFTLNVVNTNDAPTVDQGLANQSVAEDAAFSYAIPSDAFADMDAGDTLTYTATLVGGGALPSWMSLSGGVFSGTPLNEDVGSISVEVTATDSGGASVTESFTLDVSNTNDAPVVDQGIGTQNATEDAAFSFAVPTDAFEDVDAGDSLTYSAALTGGGALPAWLSFDGTTFSGTPTNDEVGSLSVEVTATDQSGATVTETFTLNVVNTNDAPTVDQGLANQSVAEDAAFSYAIPSDAFADIDAGDTFTYTATLANGDPLPSWLTLSGGVFSGTPLNGDVGSISVEVTATDSGGASVTSSFDLDVSNTNDAPVVDQGIGTQNATEDAAFSFAVPTDAFEDVDAGDSLTYSATLTGGGALPAWLSFDGTTFSGTPTNDEVGSLSVEVTATDQSGATVTETFTLNVINTNDAPTVDQGLAFQLVETDLPYSYTIPANAFDDIDVGDTLTYTATLLDGSPLPTWLTLSSAGTFSGNPVDADIAEFTVRVTATDSGGASITTDFNMKVDSAPDTNEGIIVAGVNDIAEGTLSGWDIETPRANLVFELVTGPTEGTVVINSDGTYTYTPASNFAGTDSFTYRITDENGLTREGEIDVEIYPGVVPADTGDELVNTTILGGQERPVTVGVNNGGYVVVWETSNGTGLFSQLYGADGAKIGGETTVSSGSEVDRYPEVAALSDGGYVVAWRGRAPGTGSDNHVYIKRFDRNGVETGAQTIANTNQSAAVAIALGITGLDDGGYIVSWAIANQAGDSDQEAIVAQRYDASDVKVGGEILINTSTTGNQLYPAVTQLLNGDIVFVWSSDHDPSLDGLELYGQRYNSAGVAIGGEFHINTEEDFNSQYDANVVAMANGGFLVSWRGPGTPNNHYQAMWGQLYDATGVKQGGQFQLTTSSLYNLKIQGEIAALEDGGFVATWATNNGTESEVMAQVFNASGQVTTQTFQVNTHTADWQNQPSVAALRGGGYVITWSSTQPNPGGSGYDTYKRVYAGPATLDTSFDGTIGNDVLIASDVAETLTGGGGDDVLDGGDGTDTAVFSDVRANYTISFNSGDNTWTVQHINGGADGTDTLSNIEFLKFSDVTLPTDFSTAPTVDQGITDQQAPEDSVFSFAVPADAFDDIDPADTLTYTAELSGGGALPSWLSFDGATFSGTPVNGDVGTVSVQVTATDQSGNTVTTTFDLEVVNTNDAPTVDQGIADQNGTEDVAFSFSIPADAFADEDVGDVLTYTAELADGSPLPLWLSINNGVLSGTPLDGDDGVLSVRIIATDSAGASVSEVFDLTIADNGASDDHGGKIVAGVDAAATGTLSGIDDTIVVGAETFSAVDAPSNGSVVINSDGNYTYTPNAGFAGTDTFTYQVTDGGGNTVVGEMTVTIYPETIGTLDEGQVHTTTFGAQRGPGITGLSNGGYVVVWHSAGLPGDNSGNGVAMQVYDAAGSKIGSETLVNTYITGGQDYPAVTALVGGGYVVAWANAHPANTLKARIYNNDGTAVGGEIELHANSSGYGDGPKLTALSDGGFIVTARANNYDANSHGIVAQRIAADGSKVGSEYLVNTNENGVQNNPGIVELSDGNILFVWDSADIDGTGNYQGVSGQIFDVDGTKIGSEFRVNTHLPNNQDDPSVLALKNEGFVVTWYSKGQTSGNSHTIHAQQFDNSGAKVGGEFQVGSGGQFYPESAALVDGGYVLVWSQYGSNGYDVVAQQYDALSNPVGGQVTINQYVTGQQWHPRVSGLEGGGYVVTWRSDGQDGSSDGIYSRVIDGTPGNDFTGSNGNDVLIGSDAAEIFAGQSGEDVIDGGSGTDTAKFSGNYADYSVSYDAASGEWTVVHLSGGSDGTDKLKNVERLEFADQTVISDFTTAPTVDQGVADYVGLGNEDINVSIPATAFQDADLADEFTYTAELSGGGAIPEWLDLSNGVFTGTPNNDETGTYNIVVTATDRAGNSVTDTFSITINHNPDSPIVEDGLIVAARNSSVSGVLSGSDDQSPTSSLTFSLVSGPANGSLTVNADGSYSFTPTSGYAGEDSFTYQVTDPDGNSAVAAMVVNVYPGTIGDMPEELVALTNSSVQYQSSTAGLTGGGYVVAYTTYGSDGQGNSYKIEAQMYDADGNKVGTEISVNTHYVSTQQNSSVTGLANGGFVVTYQSPLFDGAGAGVAAQLFDSVGNAIGSEILINSYYENTQQVPDITSLSNGGFVAVWETFLTGGSYQEVAMQRFDANGNKIGSEIIVNTETLNRQLAPSVTELSNGKIVVVWTGSDTHGHGIKGQIFKHDGTAFGTEFQINTESFSSQAYQSITALLGGGFVVTWVSNSQDGSGYGIFGQRYDASGVAVGNEFQINTYTSGTQDEVSTTGLADGGFVVTWKSSAQDGDEDGIFGQKYDANGVKIGAEFQINSHTASYQNQPSVAALAGGGFVVSWSSNNQDGASGYRVYRRVYDGDANIDFSGTDGNDVMSGTDENETLTGGLGADTLSGGDGADTYSYARGDGQDVIDDASTDGSSDTLELSTSIDHDQLWFEQSGDDLLISVIGTSDQITVDNWYQSADNKIETIESSDGRTLDISGVEALVTAMATFSPPSAGQTDLSDSAYDDLQDDLTANWQS